MSKLVTLDRAMAALTAARRKAEELGVAMNIALVDDGGNLVAFSRMDGAWLGSIEIAQDKAWTSRAFDISTKELASMSQPKQPLYDQVVSGRILLLHRHQADRLRSPYSGMFLKEAFFSSTFRTPHKR